MTPSSPARSIPGLAASAVQPRRRTPALFVLLALTLVAVFYLWFVRRHSCYLASNSDASGYLNVARVLRSGELIQTLPRIADLRPPIWDFYAQEPLGFTVNRETGTMTTSYPVGLPLHLLAATPFVGAEYAALAVNVFLAAAAAVLMIALGRQLELPWSWSIAAAGLLWACPLFVLFVIQVMSDVCALVWTLAALCAALEIRRHRAWAFAAGFAFAVAVLVRPSDLLLIFPLVFLLGVNARAWLAFIVGGLPGAVFLGWYNWKLYGSPLITGYGNVATLFSLGFAPHNAAHFALWICCLLSPIVAAALFGLPALLHASRRLGILLVLWVASFAGFYLFYHDSGQEWWYLRFLLPMFPALIFAALLVIRQKLKRADSATCSKWLPPVLLVVALTWEISAGRLLAITGVKHGDPPYANAARWAQAHVPSDAIILQMQLSGAFAYYASFTVVRWDLIDAKSWDRLQTAARTAGRPIYATLFDFEEPRAFAVCASPHWRRLTQMANVSVWRLDERL